MRYINLCMVSLAVSLSSCVLAQDRPIAVDEGFAIPLQDIHELQVLGVRGDQEAAFRLSLHYSSGVGASKKDANFWRHIAAENGHKVAQYSLWFFEHESSDPLARERAYYWLRRSAESGFEPAREKLKK